MAANCQFSMAVHVLAMLAHSPDGNVKSECIAGSVNTNAVVIRRLLGQLSHAGFVTSQTGAGGGTRLARAPHEITLVEIYKAVVDSEIFALHAKEPNQDCPVGKKIEAVLCNLQKETDKVICRHLSSYTLANVMEQVESAEA